MFTSPELFAVTVDGVFQPGEVSRASESRRHVESASNSASEISHHEQLDEFGLVLRIGFDHDNKALTINALGDLLCAQSRHNGSIVHGHAYFYCLYERTLH